MLEYHSVFCKKVYVKIKTILAIYVRPFCCMAHLLARSEDSIAQRRKSNNRLRQTFERKLVETAHFQNKDAVLQ